MLWSSVIWKLWLSYWLINQFSWIISEIEFAAVRIMKLLGVWLWILCASMAFDSLMVLLGIVEWMLLTSFCINLWFGRCSDGQVVAQLVEALQQATSRKVVSSIPDNITGIFLWHNPGVDSASNRKEYLGVNVAGAYGWQPYHLHVSGNLGISSWSP
jgi:hypothetical protein